MLTEMQALSSRIAFLNELATAINRNLDQKEILKVVQRQAKWVVDFDHLSVCLCEEKAWECVTLFGPSAAFDPVAHTEAGPLAQLLQTQHAQFLRTGHEASFLAGYASQLLLPLKHHDTIIGTLNIAARAPRAYTPEDVRIAHLLATQVAAALGNAHAFARLNRLKDQYERAQARGEQLLLNVLPPHIAEELQQTGRVQPVHHPEATVLFTDFAGFTRVAADMTPRALVHELHTCFSAFDAIIEAHGLEKLKTIGDSYMAVAGVPLPVKDHAVHAVRAALEIRAFMQARRTGKLAAGAPYWNTRIGIHSGPLVAGVIGQSKFAYDIWGDTVNLASRMESLGVPGEVNISPTTEQLIRDTFVCTPHEKIVVQGKGLLDMYLVKGFR